jgi:Holliday junction resolvasome RuvABC endonuclease subunit
MILGLDFGLSTGWAVLDGERVVDSGSWSNKQRGEGSKKENKRLRLSKRFGHFYKELEALLLTHPVEYVAFEYVWSHRGSRAAQAYAGYMSVMYLLCDQLGCTPWPVAWSTVKSVATLGETPVRIKVLKGRELRRSAWKKELVDCAEEAWGIIPSNDDEADALWVAESCRQGRGGDI